MAAYFCEGSEAMRISNVMYALAHICNAKASHLEENWQDRVGAKVWSKRAQFFDDKASTILMQES